MRLAQPFAPENSHNANEARQRRLAPQNSVWPRLRGCLPRTALTGDAGRAAGECGNSATVVHKHDRELVKPADAAKWFALQPVTPANIVAMPTAAAA